MHVCVCMYACVYACMYACKCVCLHVCMYVCMCSMQAPNDSSELVTSPSLDRTSAPPRSPASQVDAKAVYRHDVSIKQVGVSEFTNIPAGALLRVKVRIGCEKETYKVPYIEDQHRFPSTSVSLPTYRRQRDVLHFIIYLSSQKRCVPVRQRMCMREKAWRSRKRGA